MTDASQYTGSHKERFDKDGKGKGTFCIFVNVPPLINRDHDVAMTYFSQQFYFSCKLYKIFLVITSGRSCYFVSSLQLK